MEIRQLKIFICVCEEMNFTKAAKKLSYAQSTISDSIQSLELSLTTKLFERMGKRIYLTKKGEELYFHSKQLIEMHNSIEKLFIENQIETITIGITETLCSYKFPEFFADFLNDHDNIQVKFVILRCEEIVEMLRGNGIDIGFTLDEVIQLKDIKSINLFEEEVIFVSSDESNTLENKNIIIPTGETGYLKFFHEYYLENKIPKGTITFMENIEGTKSYLKSGFGISFMPKTSVLKDLEDKTLVEIEINKKFFHHVQILTHEEKYITSGFRALIKSATERYQNTSNS